MLTLILPLPTPANLTKVSYGGEIPKKISADQKK